MVSHDPPNRPSHQAPDALGWLSDHGDALFGYAMSRVRNREVAEELVQEAFVAALRTYQSFRAESEVKTWLIGILRHKVLDHFRRQAKQRRRTESEEQATDHYFSRQGKLQHVSTWRPDRLDTLEQREFQVILDTCLEKLGGMLSQVFMLRVMDEMESHEICTQLEITPSNLAVRLHRARLGLRDCLDRHWFGRESV